ncbi:MAG TPA: hypothetical protein ENH14_04010 [candidate division WOR-3 bacterium]|uniref:Uncharacterized protein n=1 Tax=candidate division WOR-3 bacterium TaxID=2052148 RepID=A0A7V0LV79_UNCW3|nr:hypothetical protein [Candidatus Hydrothermae bacterium]RKY97934.1 MAG: hypothetical protein DRQ03_03860 [Candidatus Hydrothermae bacterium]HDL60604.1 hypothetical protein [candidate division WOR-3 bacterium]
MNKNLKSYECKSCGTIIHVDEEAGSPLFCPMCRSSMKEINIKIPKSLSFFTCPVCDYAFYIKKGINPYKCPRCNFTFPVTPHRIHEERL